MGKHEPSYYPSYGLNSVLYWWTKETTILNNKSIICFSSCFSLLRNCTKYMREIESREPLRHTHTHTDTHSHTHTQIHTHTHTQIHTHTHTQIHTDTHTDTHTHTHTHRYRLYSEQLLHHPTFTRPVLDQLETSNYLSFNMFFNYRSFARHPFLFFLLGSYPFSTFLHTYQYYLEAFNHLSVYMFSNYRAFTRATFPLFFWNHTCFRL